KNLYEDLNSGTALQLLDEMSARQLTVVKHRKKELPLGFSDKKLACVAIGDNSWNAFHQMMNRYGSYDFYGIQRDAKPLEFSQLLAYLKQEDYDEVIISLHNTNRLVSRMYGLSP